MMVVGDKYEKINANTHAHKETMKQDSMNTIYCFRMPSVTMLLLGVQKWRTLRTTKQKKNLKIQVTEPQIWSPFNIVHFQTRQRGAWVQDS